MLRCDEVPTDRVAQDECVDQCTREIALYETWEDDEKIDRFKSEKRCLASSTCTDIADGFCYDEELFPY